MNVGNAIVSALLRSPMHRPLSRTTALIRYQGRRTGRIVTTPTQYAMRGEEVVIAVGHPDVKTWWKNFHSDHDVEILLVRRWHPMTGRALTATDAPDLVASLLDAYLRLLPKARGHLHDDHGSPRSETVLVRCRPR